jgi:hypothetical protein
MKLMENKDLILRCRKCDHLLYVDRQDLDFGLMSQLTERDCDNCGEDAGDCWILAGVGNFEKEYGGEADGE